MIIDTLANGHKYAALHPGFKAAFDYLSTIDLNSLEVGKLEVGDLKIGVMQKEGVSAETAAEKFECHNNNIDIQVLISGTETMGWGPRESLTAPKGEYNPEKDVLFYADAPQMHFTLEAGQFVIFYPEDVHAPMIGNDVIKKLVVKVKI